MIHNTHDDPVGLTAKPISMKNQAHTWKVQQ